MGPIRLEPRATEVTAILVNRELSHGFTGSSLDEIACHVERRLLHAPCVTQGLTTPTEEPPQ